MFSEERGVGECCPVAALGESERAEELNAHFLSDCTERWTVPQEANHSEQLAGGEADGGLFRRELKSGSGFLA